ncbi:MAG: YjbQ family protein [Candidatus Lokiarchaeota archaeon]|nr:YjbQ family protein [Candidatus Lokiarchaeota archaeon]
MKTHVERVPVRTGEREEIVNITGQVEAVVGKSGVSSGICVVFSMHTTCAVTINENADPDVKDDILHGLARAFPRGGNYRHAEGNSDAHLKTSAVGPSVTVVVDQGRLVLGTWQGIMLCEFDGPRARTVAVHVQGV